MTWHIFAKNQKVMSRKKELLYTYLNAEGEPYYLLPIEVPELSVFLKEKSIDLCILKFHPREEDKIGLTVGLYADIDKLSPYIFDGDGNLYLHKIIKYTSDYPSLISRLDQGRTLYEFVLLDAVFCESDVLEFEDIVWRFYGADNVEELEAFAAGQKKSFITEKELVDLYKKQVEEVATKRASSITKFIASKLDN